MKKMMSAFALASVLTLGLGQLHAQTLVNGNFDATVEIDGQNRPASWTISASRAITGAFTDGVASEPWAGPAPTPATTNDMGAFFKPFQGNATDGDATVHLTQSFPSAPGSVYLLTGWAGAEAGYSGLIPGTRTQSQIALDFLDSSSTVIGSAVRDLAAAGLGSAAGQPFGYAQYSIGGTAPAGTASVQARISMINAFGNTGGQAFVVDDFSLSVVPEPTAAALLGLGLVGVAALRRRK